MKRILLILSVSASLALAEFTRDDANGIVTDIVTGLQWQDDAVGSVMAWEEAIGHCETLELGPYTDWRLPNLNELTSLVDDTRVNPAISPVFVNTASSYYWSSTTFAGTTSGAWLVYFNYCGRSPSLKTGSFYVRCVRAGQ